MNFIKGWSRIQEKKCRYWNRYDILVNYLTIKCKKLVIIILCLLKGKTEDYTFMAHFYSLLLKGRTKILNNTW